MNTFHNTALHELSWWLYNISAMHLYNAAGRLCSETSETAHLCVVLHVVNSLHTVIFHFNGVLLICTLYAWELYAYAYA
jgi:hypothetical protein